jgi:hypothetical protein
MTQTNCCIIHYLSGSDAERDMPWLAAQIEEKAQQIAAKLGGTLSQKLDLDLLPRVLGQGGFTGSEVYISYSDQNYIIGDVQMIISHELVHRLDRETGGKLDSTLLAEGLAVYLSGGHYKPEIIPPRAAALAQMGWYIPLDKLANEFYTSQHEIGYIEAAGFVGYLVQTYGWNAFIDFYRNLPDPAGLTPAQQLSQGLQLKFQRPTGTNWLHCPFRRISARMYELRLSCLTRSEPFNASLIQQLSFSKPGSLT